MSLSRTLISMLSMTIPIVAIIGAFSVAIISTYLHFRRQRELLQMYHTERMAALEKGIELPPLSPELLGFGCHRSGRMRRGTGVVTLLVGLALTFVMWRDGGSWWGLIVVAVGLGQIITNYRDRRQFERDPGSVSPPGFGPGPGPGRPS